MTRGKHLLCEWLGIECDSFDKHSLSLFAYLLRIILCKIVETAIKNVNL